MVNKLVPEAAVFRIQSELIQELAEKEGGVFIGRCADYILREKGPVRIQDWPGGRRRKACVRNMAVMLRGPYC